MNPMTMALHLLITYAALQHGWQQPSNGIRHTIPLSYPYPHPGSLFPIFSSLSIPNTLNMERTHSTMVPKPSSSDMDVKRPPNNNDRISSKANNMMMDIKPQLPDTLLPLAIQPYSSLHRTAPDALFNDLWVKTCMVMKIVLKQPTLSEDQNAGCDGLGPSHTEWIKTLMAISCNFDNVLQYADDASVLQAKVVMCRLAHTSLNALFMVTRSSTNPFNAARASSAAHFALDSWHTKV